MASIVKYARTPVHAGTTLHARKRAAAMRKEMTEPERKLWRSLRKFLPKVVGHFRRQMPIGPYIVDFVHLGVRLVVEVDGNQHGFEKQLAHDIRRDAYLAKAGFRVLRFSNHDVMTAIMSVIDTIFANLNPAPPPLTPPREGEGRPRR